MSYVLGVPEDLALHQTHHSRVVNGIEWPLASTSEGVEVVGLGVGKQDKIVVVDLSLLSDATVAPAKGKKLRPQISRKVAEVLEMVDTSLGATPLSPSQRAEAKAFLYIGPSAASNSKSKSSGTGGAGTKTVVKGVCIAGRIEKAYKVLSSTDVGNDVTPSSSQVKVEDSQVSKEEGSDVRRQDDLLRFGEDDSAVFCSYAYLLSTSHDLSPTCFDPPAQTRRLLSSHRHPSNLHPPLISPPLDRLDPSEHRRRAIHLRYAAEERGQEGGVQSA